MDLSTGPNATAAIRQSCRHPPERIVLGNDRMEPTCSLCGQEMPMEAFTRDYLGSREKSQPAERHTA